MPMRYPMTENTAMAAVNVEVEEEPVDDRSVDDLLSFINGGNGDNKGVKTSKSKKKNRRRKDQQKNASSNCTAVSNNASSSNNEVQVHTKLQDVEDDSFAPEDEFEDGDIDDEIDPAMKEKIDREVEDFARRLNSDWPERMQEILSLGQERRPVSIPINGNGSLRRCAIDHGQK